MADLGAVKAIVATQARMDREKGPAPNLPGLSSYTHEQIMLINAAQVSSFVDLKVNSSFNLLL